MTVKIINKSDNNLPKYQTEASAGMDIMANNPQPITMKPMERKLIPTGIFIEMSNDLEAQIRPRSGLAIKHGITFIK